MLGLGQELADPTGELAARYGLDADGCVLVRPDGYVGWMSGPDSTPDDLTSAILAVTGTSARSGRTGRLKQAAFDRIRAPKTHWGVSTTVAVAETPR